MNSRAITKLQASIVIVIVVVAAAAGAGYYLLTPKEKPYITVATWGSTYLDALNNASVPFTQQYGIEVRAELQGSSNEMATKLIAEKGQPSADVFLGGEGALLRVYQAGEMANLSENVVPNLANIVPAARFPGDVYVGVYGGVAAWILRPDLIPPNLAYNGSWRWFLDPRLAGKLAVHDPTWNDQMSWAAALYGGDDHHYDPAFRFFKDLAPNLKFIFSSDDQATSALSSGEVWGVYEYGSIAYGMAQQGIKVQLVYPEDVPTVNGIKSPITFDVDVMGVVKSGKEDMAYKFINYILSPEGQYIYDSMLGNSPVNPATKAMPSGIAPYLLTGDQLKRAWVADLVYYQSIEDRLVERWQTEIVPLVGKPASTGTSSSSLVSSILLVSALAPAHGSALARLRWKLF
jgi:ABC-type Fe3+ transport system substrate-binding protein